MFKGIVNYVDPEDNNCLTIEFIEREHEAAIRVTTTWGEYGAFTIDAIAKKQGDVYTTPPIYPAFACPSKSSINSDISASISLKVISRSEDTIDVIGVWREQGKAYKFAGELELQ